MAAENITLLFAHDESISVDKTHLYQMKFFDDFFVDFPTAEAIDFSDWEKADAMLFAKLLPKLNYGIFKKPADDWHSFFLTFCDETQHLAKDTDLRYINRNYTLLIRNAAFLHFTGMCSWTLWWIVREFVLHESIRASGEHELWALHDEIKKYELYFPATNVSDAIEEIYFILEIFDNISDYLQKDKTNVKILYIYKNTEFTQQFSLQHFQEKFICDRSKYQKFWEIFIVSACQKEKYKYFYLKRRCLKVRMLKDKDPTMQIFTFTFY